MAVAWSLNLEIENGYEKIDSNHGSTGAGTEDDD